MHRRTPTRALALVAGSLLVLGLAACGDDDDPVAADDPTTTTTEAPADAPADGGDAVTIIAEDFSLTSVTAKAGETVRLSNEGAKPHTATADEGDAFDSGTVQPGGEAEFTAPSEPGEYTFHCSIHASMTGTLTVEA